jgi:hypothetical protein
VNQQIAMVSAGILKLSNKEQDRPALYIACNLATLARMNGYRSKQLTGDQLARMAGTARIKTRANGRERRTDSRPARRSRGYRVMGLCHPGDPVEDPDDLDNPATLAGLADDGLAPDFRARRVRIEWPDVLQAAGVALADKKQLRLQAAQAGKGEATQKSQGNTRVKALRAD